MDVYTKASEGMGGTPGQDRSGEQRVPASVRVGEGAKHGAGEFRRGAEGLPHHRKSIPGA